MASEHFAASESVPPIVLFVGDRDTLDVYLPRFEEAGFWMAGATTPPEAVGAIADLKPDLVVAETDAVAPDAGPDLVGALRHDEAAKEVPIILLTEARCTEATEGMAAQVDLILVKPVPPDALLTRVAELLAWSKTLRARSKKTSARVTCLIDRSNQLLDRGERIKAQTESTNRPCPSCGVLLEWLERGTLGGVEYDYYRWCRNGCGLFCYDLTHAGAVRWIKLA